MAINLLSGLEKFGFKGEAFDIMGEDEKKDPKKGAAAATAAAKPLEEKDYLLEKKITCAICDRPFTALTVKSNKAKRMEPDADLRPNFEGVDVNKYDVYACPHCGYAALSKSFEHPSPSQIKWVKEAVCNSFRPTSAAVSLGIYLYEEAVDRYKLALVSAMAKRVKLSEKSYICLKIAWLLRPMIAAIPDDAPADKLKQREEYKAEYESFYRQAYDGFMKASSTETPPFYGMNENTLEYMLANMAFYFKDYPTASKLVSRLLTSSNTPSKVKDLCLELKKNITDEVKKAGQGAGQA